MVLPLAAVVVLMIVWSVYWYAARSIFEREMSRARLVLAGNGHQLLCSTESWSGFPFRFEFSCENPVLEETRGLEIASQRLQVVALAYKPWHIIALQDGPTEIQVPGLTPIHLTHDRAMASATATSTNSGQITAELTMLAASQLFSADRVLFSARTSDLKQIDAVTEITAFSLTVPGPPPLILDHLSADTTITPSNTLVINGAEARHGAVTLSATGLIALDTLGRPAGQVMLQTNDGAKLLELAAPYLALDAQQRAALAALLTVAGNQLTLTAGDGALYAGPLKISDLAPLP
jgi:hypothetical protein